MKHVEAMNASGKKQVIKTWSRASTIFPEFLDEALAILQYTPKAACEPLLKLVKSAAANAENNFNMDKNNLYVAECYVCPGPTLKRMMPRAQGRGYRILKRTSHMTVVLKEKE